MNFRCRPQVDFSEHRIDYAVVLRKCIQYGYCAAVTDDTSQDAGMQAAALRDAAILVRT